LPLAGLCHVSVGRERRMLRFSLPLRCALRLQRGGGQRHARHVPSRDWWQINQTSDAGHSQRGFLGGRASDVPAHRHESGCLLRGFEPRLLLAATARLHWQNDAAELLVISRGVGCRWCRERVEARTGMVGHSTVEAWVLVGWLPVEVEFVVFDVA